jgi:hypothetical protein
VKGLKSEPKNSILISRLSFSCNQISLTVLLCQWSLLVADPGIVEVSPPFRRSRGEKSPISTKLPSYNAITDIEETTTVTPSTTSSFQSFKITADDVVKGSNSVYGSHAQIQNGGIIYAISQSHGSSGQHGQSLMSAGKLITCLKC